MWRFGQLIRSMLHIFELLTRQPVFISTYVHRCTLTSQAAGLEAESKKMRARISELELQLANATRRTVDDNMRMASLLEEVQMLRARSVPHRPLTSRSSASSTGSGGPLASPSAQPSLVRTLISASVCVYFVCYDKYVPLLLNCTVLFVVPSMPANS